jgi:predicted nucleotidyltransferase
MLFSFADVNTTESAPTLVAIFDAILAATLDACHRHYGERLVALAVFGSVGRGTMRPNSDIDLLLVVDPLADGRMPRVEEFGAVERMLAGVLDDARRRNVATELSPVFRTPAELADGSPLLLDMIEDARLLYDRAGVLAGALEALGRRLAALGARRIWRGNAWYWDLKPDYRPGDVFSL